MYQAMPDYTGLLEDTNEAAQATKQHNMLEWVVVLREN